MIEIPESKTIGLQAADTLTGRRIIKVLNSTAPHKFAFFNGDPSKYPALLEGREVRSARGHGMFVDLCCDGDTCITIGEGTNMRYYSSAEQCPGKYQLLINFDDGSCISFNVAMYGGIWAYKSTLDNPYYKLSISRTSPLDDTFDEKYFDEIFKSTSKEVSMKALLATGQRIPGLGNGVLQDILFNARLHPRRKKSSLSGDQKSELFQSLKTTLKKMTEMGGRDTEKDLFGHSGGYKTLLSKKAANSPCPNCGTGIIKEAYLGGAVYFCPACQSL